jgi:CubicO group peptidase (beta-lactamase class C family)
MSFDGCLVFARGYGDAKVDTGELVQPDSLFQVASNTKPIKVTAIVKLIEQGRPTLGTKPCATILSDLVPPSGVTADPRYKDITIEDLLEHKAKSDDPMLPDPVFQFPDISATAYGVATPATPFYLINYMLGQTLQHDPGLPMLTRTSVT